MGKSGTRYEFVGETKGGKPSHKFWIATLSGTEVIIHFGKVDTKGQTRVKKCSTTEEAKQYLKDKTDEKIKKGYKPV